MRAAALDLGTNTFLCLIVEGDRNGIQSVLRDEVETVRLGQGVDKTGEFHPDALKRARETLTRFKKMIDDLGDVTSILGVATSAARDVKNGRELFKIGEDLQLPLKVIDGPTEAKLSYSGACAEFQDQKRRLVIDIGGGSTELILGQGAQLSVAKSVDLGGVRLTERIISQQPVPQSEREALQKLIVQNMAGVIGELKAQKIDELIAVAGTPTALAAAEIGEFIPEKVNGYIISKEKLFAWREEFANTTVEFKKTKYQLGGRADIIYAGVSVLCHVVEALGQSGVKVSTKGLRYGLAHQLLIES